MTATVLFYSFLFTLVFLFAGLGLTMLISPKGLRKYTLFISPVIGFSYVTLAGWHLATFGVKPVFNAEGKVTAINSTSSMVFGGTDSYAWFMLLPPAVFLAVAVYRNRKNIGEAAGLARGLIMPLAVSMAAFIMISVPLFKHGEELTTVCPGNHDLIDSAFKARQMKEFSLADTTGELSRLMEDGHNPYKNDVLTNRFGAPLAVAFLSSIFRLEAYQPLSVVSNLIFFFGVLLVYILLREVFKFDEFPSLMVAAIYGFSPIMYYLVYQGFQHQLTGMTMTVGFFLVQFYAMEQCRKFSDYLVFIPLLSLLNWGINISYAHMLPILYLPVIAYMALRSVNNRSYGDIAGWAGFQASALALTAAFSPLRMKHLIANLIYHAGTEAGWDMPYFSPDYVVGLNYIDIMPQLTNVGYLPFFKPLLGYGMKLSKSAEAFLHILVSVPLAATVIYGLRRLFKGERTVFLVSSACLLFVVGGQNFIYLMTPVSPQYKSFKLIAYFLPLAIPVFMIAFRNASLKGKGQIAGYALALIVAGSVFSSMLFVGSNFDGRYVDRDLAEVNKVESMPQVESVNILGYNWWETMWLNTFLIKKKQYFESCFYLGRCTGEVIDGQWDVWNMRTNGVPPQTCGDDMIALNSTYALMRTHRLPDEAMRAELSLVGGLNNIRVGNKGAVTVRVKNISGQKWDTRCDAVRKLYLSYKWFTPDGAQVQDGMGGVPLPGDLGPGEELVVELPVRAPSQAGRYAFVIDILQGRVSWFAQKGSRPISLEVSL